MLIGNYFYYQVPSVFPELSLTSVYYVLFCLLAFVLCRPFKSFLRPYVLFVLNGVFLWSFSRDLSFLLIAFLLSVLTYVSGLLVARYRNSAVLYASVAVLALILCFYKYAGYFTNNIVIPLGLSFYSFKSISYLCDIYKRKIRCEIDPVYLIDYILFFPCITAGPINRAKEFIDELHDPSAFDYRESKGGGLQLVLGIFEKMVFCDYVALIVNGTLGAAEVTGLNLLFGVFLYSFQIYLDFDSLSNIAIGSARLLGFKIPKNFNSPYLAVDLKDFWRRWHISLSQWFRDYIYIPLGGSRKGDVRRYINLLIVFIVSGLWHGSTWNFLLWGILHGLIQIAEDLLFRPFKKMGLSKTVQYLLYLPGIVTNFMIVSFLWLIFRTSDLKTVVDIAGRIFAGGPFDLGSLGYTVNEICWLFIVLCVVIVTDILRDHWDMIGVFNKMYLPFRWLFYALIVVVFLVFGVYGGSFSSADFIYRFF